MSSIPATAANATQPCVPRLAVKALWNKAAALHAAEDSSHLKSAQMMNASPPFELLHAVLKWNTLAALTLLAAKRGGEKKKNHPSGILI